MKTQKSSVALKIVLAVFAIFCVVVVFKLKIEIDELSAEQKQLEEQLEASQANVDRLQKHLDAEFDEEYVIDIAKDKLNLVLPEEIIFYNNVAG